MAFSAEQVTEGLKFLRANKRYFSPKTLAAQSGLPLELLQSLIAILPTLPLVKLNLTPGGKFINFGLTYAAKGYVFILPDRVWYDGRLAESGGNCLFSRETYRRHDRYYSDMAARNGLRCFGRLDTLVLSKVVFDTLYPNHAADVAKAALEDSLKHLFDYPDALKRVRELMALEVEQEKELARLLKSSQDSQAHYEREKRLADNGQRTRQEAYSVVVGREEVFTGMVLNTGNAWEGTDDHYEPRFESMNKYETRYRTVVDHPKPPKLNTEAIENVRRALRENQSEQASIKHNPVSFQKAINEQRRLEKLADEYREKRRSLDREYKQHGLDVESISRQRVVFA